jgi:[acyl-carrier-protein] S-malonyltransferase
LLVLGQQDTVDRLTERLRGVTGPAIHVRKNDHRWPPLHMPIVWERAVPNRARVMMHTIRGGFTRPTPPIVSLVTGKMSYTEDNCRELVGQWIDHPQRLWDAVCATLSAGVRTVIHVGPEPNLIPATFERLAANVREQIQGRSLSSLSMRAVGGMARQSWLRALLPHRAALLHAPQLEHVILEDWLLAAVRAKAA